MLNFRGYPRPELKRSDDPLWWDQTKAADEARERAAANLKPENWSHARQLALLMIERSDGAKECVKAMAGLRASQDDFAFLRKAGFAERPLGNRYHRLTESGRRAARECIAIVARRHGLHLTTIDMDRWSEHKVRCTCGWNASLNRRNNQGAYSYLTMRAGRHLKEVGAT